MLYSLACNFLSKKNVEIEIILVRNKPFFANNLNFDHKIGFIYFIKEIKKYIYIVKFI